MKKERRFLEAGALNLSTLDSVKAVSSNFITLIVLKLEKIMVSNPQQERRYKLVGSFRHHKKMIDTMSSCGIYLYKYHEQRHCRVYSSAKEGRSVITKISKSPIKRQEGSLRYVLLGVKTLL